MYFEDQFLVSLYLEYKGHPFHSPLEHLYNYITPSHQYTCNSTLTFIPAWALLHTSPSNSCQLFHLLYIFSSSICVSIIPNEQVLILTFYQCPLFDNHTLLQIPPCRLFYVHWNHSLLTAKKKKKKINISCRVGVFFYTSSMFYYFSQRITIIPIKWPWTWRSTLTSTFEHIYKKSLFSIVKSLGQETLIKITQSMM